MHLKRLRVENFRALEKIDVEFDTRTSVIIGPNAVGKTTVLEAIRLAKGLLAPRTQNESNMILQGLGAFSPHIPQRLLSSALTSRPNLPLSVRCCYDLTPAELARIRAMTPQLVTSLAQQNSGIAFSTPAQLVSFLSSPLGQQSLLGAKSLLDTEISRCESTRRVELNLTIDFKTGQITGEFPMQQMIVAALEQTLGPNETLFSYFPADRALPAGEQPVQLGIADTVNQLESYNSQPQQKYQRLKNTIFNSIISNDSGRKDLKGQFEFIFQNILRGRELGEIGVNSLGMLSIPIKELESQTEFQIDGLSSGEKGLVLTFLLMSQNVAEGGIILLDEPELHLNPAVCRNLLQFFVDEYAEKKTIQGIICSHSPEILASTFERTSSALFHLKSGTSLAKVRYKDQGEIRDALRRLGSSESEALLYKGTVSVEGLHDIEMLQAGFDEMLRRYRLKQRGGRGQIEADIQELQKAEKRGDDIGNHFFVFDLDHKPTGLSDTQHVRLLQLNRYCLENFVLDVDVLTDLSRKPEFSESPKSSPTEMRDVMRGLAMAQLDEFVARSVFKEMGLESIGFDMEVMRLPGGAAIASALHQRIDVMAKQFQLLKTEGVEKIFSALFSTKRRELESIWEERWREKCNGKRLLEALRRDGHFKGDLLRLKKAAMSMIRENKTEAFNSLSTMLRDLIDEADSGSTS